MPDTSRFCEGGPERKQTKKKTKKNAKRSKRNADTARLDHTQRRLLHQQHPDNRPSLPALAMVAGGAHTCRHPTRGPAPPGLVTKPAPVSSFSKQRPVASWIDQRATAKPNLQFFFVFLPGRRNGGANKLLQAFATHVNQNLAERSRLLLLAAEKGGRVVRGTHHKQQDGIGVKRTE